jgi:poly(A) polymerase
MIKKFIDQLISKATGRPAAKPKFGKRLEIPAAEHGIDRAKVDERALAVVSTLKAGGFEAYIVGGAVRDLLLGLVPKDFDVATNATPEQVKQLFRRAFIIGRRFRIVHVVYGRGREHEVIEVSTFRKYLDNAAAEPVAGNEKTSRQQLAGMEHAVDASGRVLRDNVWGPQNEDAARRDFTVNGLYYDPERQIVVDYHGGFKDVRAKRLRLIGDPATRYREDPVRILRAARFCAKLSALGFQFDPKTAAPIAGMKGLLADVPQSRLHDEMLKLLQTGHGPASVAQLRALGLQSGVYPLLDLVVERADEPMVAAALQDTDRRVAEGKSVVPSFLLACVLWRDVQALWAARQARGVPPFPALQESIDEVFDARVGDVSGRGKLGADMREIWMMQPRFERRSGHAPFSLVEQPRFRAGFDFMRLRADAGEIDELLADWWQEFSTADDAARRDLVEQVRLDRQGGGQAGRGRQRPARGPAPQAPRESAEGPLSIPPDGEAPGEHSPSVGDGAPPARKRRRRRRSGARGQSGGEGGEGAAGGGGPTAGEPNGGGA